MEEARAAYYEKATVPRQMMESLTYSVYELQQLQKQAELLILENTTTVEPILNSTEGIQEEVLGESLDVETDGTTILVNENVSTIYLNINGTIVELMVNGTQISQVSS